jgi:hypothetical protein
MTEPQATCIAVTATEEARTVRVAAMDSALPEPEPEPEPALPQRGPSGAVKGSSELPAEVAVAAKQGSTLPWAEQLDVHTAYQPALQPHPQDDVDFYLHAYEHLHAGVSPKSLREDFCGTSALPPTRLLALLVATGVPVTILLRVRLLHSAGVHCV